MFDRVGRLSRNDGIKDRLLQENDPCNTFHNTDTCTQSYFDIFISASMSQDSRVELELNRDSIGSDFTTANSLKLTPEEQWIFHQHIESEGREPSSIRTFH